MGLPPAPPQPTRPSHPADPRTQAVRATTFADNSTQALTPAGATATSLLEGGPTPISPPLPPPPAQAPADPRTMATGPVDFLPDPPSAEPGSAEAPVQRTPRRPRQRLPIAALGLTAASIGLLEAGLLDGGRGSSLWSTVPLWSGFATLAAVLGLLVGLTRGRGLRDDGAWKVSAAGLTGVSAFWVLVVLPIAATDRGFVLTAALACLGLGLWVTPGRHA